jgi:hypothetical protein
MEIPYEVLSGIGLFLGGVGTYIGSYIKKRLKELEELRQAHIQLSVKVARLEERLIVNAKNRNKKKYEGD